MTKEKIEFLDYDQMVDKFAELLPVNIKLLSWVKSFDGSGRIVVIAISSNFSDLNTMIGRFCVPLNEKENHLWVLVEIISYFFRVSQIEVIAQLAIKENPIEAANAVSQEDELNNLKAKYANLVGLIDDVLYEAQNHPQRLVSFNSPLLGLLMLERYVEKNTGYNSDDIDRTMSEFRAVIEHNRRKDMGV